LVALAVGAVWLTLDDRFYVYQADVTGIARLSSDDIFQVSGLSGLHILWVRPEEIEERILAALPSLESVHVACRVQSLALQDRLSALCKITVTERRPRVMWSENGRLWGIDAEGVIFPAQASVQEMLSDGDGWLVEGPLARDKDGRLDERVHVALTELWATGVEVAPLLYYVPSRGIVLTDERGWRVILGQGPGMERRLQVLEQLAAGLEARSLTPSFVDVRFSDAPYYSLTNDW
jgi:hypothetical protein